MRRKWNRFVAGLLSIVLLVTMLPMEVLAAGNGGRAEQPSQTMPFQDVKSSDWCAKAVEYVYSHNLFSGTSATTFTPNGTMTRGMFVTVLGRMAGVNPDDHSGETPFSDVPQTMYYAPYVQWAARYGITAGTGDGKFSPDAFINRAQMAAFFVRYFEAFQVDYATGANVTTAPADLDRTPAYAQDAVLKLWKQGLLNGDGTRFAPEGNATRAQMATLCMRADEAVEIWYSAPGIVGRKSGETPQKEDQSKPNSGSNSSGSSSSGGSSGGSGSDSTTHTITLHLPDGTTSTFTQTTSALSLANLPTPSVAGKAFVGWYYDENYNKAVADGDPLSENLSLYAKMVDYDAIEGVETPTYAGATDVGPNFTIRVNSDSESDLTGKISLIGTEQPTSEVDADGNTILVVGSVRNNHDGTYTVAPPAGGWAEGGTYKVVLEDNSLYFDGTAPSVREYHFTVKAGTPALEWHLRDEVVAIPAGDITAATQDGAAVAALNMPVVTFDGSGTTADDVSGGTGTFVYGGELEIGSTVAIYEGAAPEERVAVGTTDANTGDVSYVKITGVDKTTNTYSYQSAAVEDVLFVPDVLPVQAKCKEDQTANTSGGYTILVPVEELTFTTASGVGNLDENTTVDVGDFLAFYTGKSYTTENAASDGYGRITAVDHTTDENTGVACYQLTYTDATEDDVLSSMDVDTTDPISGDAMLDGVDTEKLEEQIARQAIESGFAQTVADRISVAIDEMDLSDLTAGDEIDLRSIDIDPEDALGISALSMNAVRDSGAVSPARANANGGGKASVKVKSAKITKHLQNFTDASGKPLSGVRLELQLEVTKEIQKDGGSIVITVTPTFIQELKIDLSTHGKLVWKRKFIFFWISDVYLEAALNVYTYTAINLDATITSQGEKDTVTKVKDLVDKLGKKLAALEGKDTGGEREEIDTSKLNLRELYNSMLELDSDWVELYRKNIFSIKKTVAKIIKFELTADFVVEMNIRMAMGMNFNYTNAKRYVFGVYLFKRRTTTCTYNLVNEQYNLRLYAMGAVGLRAGVEIWPSVSLISKKVATVGIVAKLGAYLKGYGYVLYALHYEAGKPKTSNASGALYVEVGMFMDISANLSAFKGKVSWTPEIYTDETPLWSAGSTYAITAFEMKDADGEDDTPTVYLKNGGLDVLLPQSLQALTGFDLITGKDRTETYDWNKFDISFDDPRFSTYHTGVYGGNYSQQHIKLNLSDWQTCDEPEIDCVMTLTYKGSDLSFSINPVQLKVKVHWDRLRDGYPIHELSSIGGYIGWEQRRFREALNLKTPTPTGYTFKGWTYYLLKNESDIFSYTEADRYDSTTMPESALVAVATFELRTDIPYTLNFYLQNVDGTYPETPTESVIHHGTAYDYFVPDEVLVPDKIGYYHPHYAPIHIRPDGTGGQDYYYSRMPFTLILNSNGQVSTVPYRYGAKLDRLNEDPARLGYIFDGWYTDETYQNEFTETTMPAKNLTLYAKWQPDYIYYFLVLRKEGEDGKWSQTTKIQIGKTDETVTIDPADFLTEAEKDTYVIPQTVSYTVSAEDGGTVSISYARKWFSLTYDLNAADAGWVSDPGVRQYRVGAVLELLTQSHVTRAGYTFDGWYTDVDCTTEFTAATMPAKDLTLYASYTRKWFSLTYDLNAADARWVSDPGVIQYRVGDVLELLTQSYVKRAGYIFAGWYTDVDCTTEFTAAPMPAKDLTLYAKWLPDDINYFLVLRKEGADGKWSQTTETRTGKTGETVTIDPADFLTEAEKDTYVIPQTVSYTVSAEDGGTVSISYARKWFSLTYDLNAADAGWVSDPGVKQYRVGAVLKLLTQSYVKRAGYTFDGWYTDADCTTEFTAATMPAENITLYAKWTAQGGISYTVEHYQQNVTDDDYTLADRESKTGAAGQLTAAESKSYLGFTVQGFDQQTVKGDGSTVVKVYYNRNEYTLTYDLNGSDAAWTDSETDQSHKYRFGAEITTPTSNDLSRAGYAFGGWYTDADCTAEFTATTMPAENTTLYAKWNAGQVNYTVNYYLQNVDGTTYPNTPSETVPGSGVTDQTVDVQKSFEGFTPRSDTPSSITLQADSAQNVVDLYYTRNRYTLSFNLGDGVILDEGSAPAGGDIYYGAEISVDMTNVKRTGYTFVGWYEDEAYQTEWSGTTMPARDITLYAKWDVMTYFLRFDWDGNVPLRDWLLKSGGKLLTAEYDKANGVYTNANNHGIPYIDVTVEYDQVFTLPTEIPGAEYFGYYEKKEGYWGPYESLVASESLTKMAAEQDAIVKVGVQWRSETDSNGAELLYNANDFLTKVVQDYSYNAASYALGVDLDLCNVNMTFNGDIVGGITFDGKDHTIFNVKRSEGSVYHATGSIYGYGDNVTVKDLTIDGMTVDYTAAVDSSSNTYHAFGALAGFVGDGFKAENVTVKNVTMNLSLLGEQGDASTSAHLLPAECIGGLIGYAKGTVTLTGCTVENMTVNVTDMNDSGGTQFLVGGLIGYADALYTQIPGENEYSSSNDYNGDGSVTITGCAVSRMTVNENDATGVSVGGFLGGIGKSVTSNTGIAYSVTANIDEVSTFPNEFTRIGKELTMNDSTASNSAARSLDAMPAAAFEDESDEENTAA